MKLLVVEDEKGLQGIIAKGLRKCGYAVDTADDGEDALELLEINEYDLIVLDLNLPKVDGIEVLRTVRSTNKTMKILILSARAEIEDRILGLDDGANDYLVKPFDFKELEARIRCQLRQQVVMQSLELTVAGITLDQAKCIAALGRRELQLTKKEYAILQYLMIHKNTVISSEQLIEHVWDSEVDLFSNSLKFHMSSLRKKIAEQTDAEIIHNIRGRGYMIKDMAVDNL